VTPRSLNLLATVALAVCWGAFGLTWLVGAIYNQFEEKLMLAEFPDDYPRYRQRVPKLIPGLRLLAGRRVASG
jgi:protein-S-isoprenylcysteine O-methyltransferase Ste14